MILLCRLLMLVIGVRLWTLGLLGVVSLLAVSRWIRILM